MWWVFIHWWFFVFFFPEASKIFLLTLFFRYWDIWNKFKSWVTPLNTWLVSEWKAKLQTPGKEVGQVQESQVGQVLRTCFFYAPRDIPFPFPCKFFLAWVPFPFHLSAWYPAFLVSSKQSIFSKTNKRRQNRNIACAFLTAKYLAILV